MDPKKSTSTLSYAPKEPRSAVSLTAVLSPCTEVVAAYSRLPASAHNREVVLPTEELLRLASKAIAEVRTSNNRIRRAEADHVMAQDEKEMADIEKKIEEYKAELQAMFEDPGESLYSHLA